MLALQYTHRLPADDDMRLIVDAFGRPGVETRLPLDVCIGKARRTGFVQREEQQISPSADRAALLEAARDRNRRRVARPDTVAAWSVLDATNWKLVRFVLSDTAPVTDEGRLCHGVLHVAAPGLEDQG
jgi:hypothetical protein